jgi:hypothetical protein
MHCARADLPGLEAPGKAGKMAGKPGMVEEKKEKMLPLDFKYTSPFPPRGPGWPCLWCRLPASVERLHTNPPPPPSCLSPRLTLCSRPPPHLRAVVAPPLYHHLSPVFRLRHVCAGCRKSGLDPLGSVGLPRAPFDPLGSLGLPRAGDTDKERLQASQGGAAAESIHALGKAGRHRDGEGAGEGPSSRAPSRIEGPSSRAPSRIDAAGGGGEGVARSETNSERTGAGGWQDRVDFELLMRAIASRSGGPSVPNAAALQLDGAFWAQVEGLKDALGVPKLAQRAQGLEGVVEKLWGRFALFKAQILKSTPLVAVYSEHAGR